MLSFVQLLCLEVQLGGHLLLIMKQQMAVPQVSFNITLCMCFKYECASIFYTAPSDYTSVSGSFDMTDTNTVQCIPVSIVSDSVTETDEECFTFTLSTTSTAAGLTLSPTSATICINDPEEGTYTSQISHLTNLLCIRCRCDGECNYWTKAVLLFNYGGPRASRNMYFCTVW